MVNIWQVRTVWTGVTGTPYYTTTHWALNPAVSNQPQTAVNQMGNFWNDASPRVANTAAYTVQGQVNLIQDSTGALIDQVNVTPFSGVGTGTGDILPWQTQGLVRLFTATVVDGRRLKGRIFTPAPLESDNGLGVPSGTFKSDWDLAVVDRLIATGDSNMHCCIWHRPVKNDAGGLVREGSSALVTSGTTQSYWAELRTRRQ